MKYVTLMEASKETKVPVERIKNLIRNNRINGVLIPGSTDLGYIPEEDLKALAEV